MCSAAQRANHNLPLGAARWMTSPTQAEDEGGSIWQAVCLRSWIPWEDGDGRVACSGGPLPLLAYLSQIHRS